LLRKLTLANQALLLFGALHLPETEGCASGN
jgi:hypothetical protein